MSDIAAHAYATLRAETAEMLGFSSVDDLAPIDGLKLELCSLLRLQLDRQQGRALAGQEVDLGDLQSCFNMLSRLLPAAVAEPVMRQEEDDPHERLIALMDQIEAAHEAEIAEALQREEAVMAAEALAHLEASPALPNVASAAAATPPAPIQISNQPPLPPRDPNNQPPKRYLADHSQPWRPYVVGPRW